jgi:hypothetical protein
MEKFWAKNGQHFIRKIGKILGTDVKLSEHVTNVCEQVDRHYFN